MESSNDESINVFGEVKEHNDKKFQFLLNSKDMLEYQIQQEKYHNESLIWEIKHFEGQNAVAIDKNMIDYEDLDELFHENEGLKEQIESGESQLDMADLSVTLAGIELGEDTRICCQTTSSHQMEDKDSEREDKLKALQQMSINLQNEISRLDQEILAMDSKIPTIDLGLQGIDLVVDHASRLW